MGECSLGVAKKGSLTPKAIIFQKFGNKACYKVEEIQGGSQKDCPGLAIPQNGPCLYRCCLELPEFSVVSDSCKKKKDAEQSAAEKALQKLGVNFTENKDLTEQEAWDNLVARLSYLFSDKFLSSVHPLSCHFRAALRREGYFNGFVPASVIAVYDAKPSSLCKYINPEVEFNPVMVISFVLRAGGRLSGSVSTSKNQLSLRRQNSYSPEVLHSLLGQQPSNPETICVKAIRIPCSIEKTVESLTLDVPCNGYYLDAIARELGVIDASEVMISRTIGKASSETRLYFRTPKSYVLNSMSELHEKEAVQYEEPLNVRASYFSGQVIHGDVILASIGYTWKSTDLFHEDVLLRTYYRILVSKIPGGVYKLSREALLVAELPVAYTTRSNWRGSFPKDILIVLCRQHHLSEPIFSTLSVPMDSMADLPGAHKKLKVTDSGKEVNEGSGIEPVRSGETFRCEVKIYSKRRDLLIHCSPQEYYKKQSDSIHNAALKVLSWFNIYFRNLDMSIEKLALYANEFDVQLHPENFSKEFLFCGTVHSYHKNVDSQAGRLLGFDSTSQPNLMSENNVYSSRIGGPDTGVTPSLGSLACISCSVSLVKEEEYVKELLESSEEFEFEIGTGAVIPCLEAVVTQISVGQSACFNMDFPAQEFILAAAADSARTLSLLSSRGCSLEYSVTLLRVAEPLEDRMEQALFSPPLSKQRVEYALQRIKESCATSLADFGCGSGSLLDSLLEYSTSLERIVGVDLSQKSLTRAAKAMHSKLNANSESLVPRNKIKSAMLYEGSITTFDSRLYGVDIGTCLEVIEHMEEKEACLFGDLVLSSFCPRILVVSTPNYEYNVILQKSSLQSQDDDPDEKHQPQSCKFRNHDHKFEWTREQFNNWASGLAARHNYSVEFSGVGGVADVEPGFASQIAVFRRSNDRPENVDSAQHYNVLWEWSSTSRSRSAL